MISPVNALQIAASATLVADVVTSQLAAQTDAGPAVFAKGQDFADVYPRYTLEPPQRINADNGCSIGADLILTIHSWAQGPDCTLVAGELADAAILALSSALVLTGWRVAAWEFLSSRPVGDPDETVEHYVTSLRYTVRPGG
jgi:hypothetical protein